LPTAALLPHQALLPMAGAPRSGRVVAPAPSLKMELWGHGHPFQWRTPRPAKAFFLSRALFVPRSEVMLAFCQLPSFLNCRSFVPPWLQTSHGTTSSSFFEAISFPVSYFASGSRFRRVDVPRDSHGLNVSSLPLFTDFSSEGFFPFSSLTPLTFRRPSLVPRLPWPALAQTLQGSENTSPSLSSFEVIFPILISPPGLAYST